VDVLHIARVQRARLLVHVVLDLLELANGCERDEQQREDSGGVLGSEGGELGQEPCLVLTGKGMHGLATLDEERPARRAWRDKCGGGWSA